MRHADIDPLPVLSIEGDDLMCSVIRVREPVAIPVIDEVVDDPVIAHEEACRQVPVPQSFKDRLTAFHCGRLSLAISDFNTLYRTLDARFRNFAYRIKAFNQLHPDDQELLLTANGPLYYQLYLARYVNSADAISQLQCLIGEAPVWASDQLLTISFRYLASATVLFRNVHTIDFYEGYAHRARGVEQVTSPQLSFLANCLLFRHNNTLSMAVPDRVRMAWRQSIDEATRSPSAPFPHNMTTFLIDGISALERMSQFYSHNANLDENDARTNVEEVSITVQPEFTIEEDLWLKHHIRVFNDKYKSVQVGDELLREFSMYALDVPLSQTFLSDSLTVFSERFRRVLKSQTEFTSLHDAKQAKLCYLNAYRSSALKVAWLDSLETGEQQVQDVMGLYDTNFWNLRMSEMAKRLKKFSFPAWVQHSHINVSPSHLSEYTSLVHQVGSVLGGVDNELVHLAQLILLFDSVEDSELRRLQECYVVMLKRKAECMFGPTEGARTFRAVLKILGENVPRMTELLQLMLFKAQ